MICEGSGHEYYVLADICHDSAIVVCFDLMFSILTCCLLLLQEGCVAFDYELWMSDTIGWIFTIDS